MANKTEICLIDNGLKCIENVKFNPKIESVNLHHNLITNINPNSFPKWITSLDLSSNKLSSLTGVQFLTQLRYLNLSANCLCNLKEIYFLAALERLDVSYNDLETLSDLRNLQDRPSALSHLNVRCNRLSSTAELIQDLMVCRKLKELDIAEDSPSKSTDNPLCQNFGFRSMIFCGLPQLELMDGNSRRVVVEAFMHDEVNQSSKYFIDEIQSQNANKTCIQPETRVEAKRKNFRIVDVENVSIAPKQRVVEMHKPCRERLRYTHYDETDKQFTVPNKPKLDLSKELVAILKKDLSRERASREKIVKENEEMTRKITSMKCVGEQENILKIKLSKVSQQLTLEKKDRKFFEERIRLIIFQLASSIQRFEDLSQAFKGYSEAVIQKNSFLEDNHAFSESMWAGRLLASENKCDEIKKNYSFQEQMILQKHSIEKEQLKSDLNSTFTKYRDLEDEFRVALMSEAERYKNVLVEKQLTEILAKEKNEELAAYDKNLASANTVLEDMRKNHKELNLRLIQEKSRNHNLENDSKLQISTLKARIDDQASQIKKMSTHFNETSKLRLEVAALKKKISDASKMKTFMKDKAENEGKLKDENERLLGEISSMNGQISDLQLKLQDQFDTVRVKTKIIDNHIDSIKTLKQELSSNKALIEKAEMESNTRESELKLFINNLEKKTQTEINTLIDRKNSLKDRICDLQSTIDELELANKKLVSEAGVRDLQLKQISEKIDFFNSFWKNRAPDLEKERKEAIKKVQQLSLALVKATESLSQANARHIELQESSTRKLNEVRQSANLRVYELEQEMREILLENVESRRNVGATLQNIAGSMLSPIEYEPC